GFLLGLGSNVRCPGRRKRCDRSGSHWVRREPDGVHGVPALPTRHRLTYCVLPVLVARRRVRHFIIVKLVHPAALRLDSPVRGLPRYPGAPVEAAALATRRAFAALVTLCVEEQASLLLLAGDLVDAYGRDHKTGLFFVREMLRLREAGVLVYSVRGN